MPNFSDDMSRDSAVALLKLLLQTSGPHHRDDLMAELRLEEGELAKAIENLRESGCSVGQQENHLTLMGEPAGLTPYSIGARLHTSVVGRHIVVLHETGSTNDRVRQAGEGGASEGLAIFAEKQTAGRGQFGRSWISAAGQGLWFSILLRAKAEDQPFHWIIQAAAIAAARTLRPLLGNEMHLKWPNDLMFNGAKLGGLLLEIPAAGGFQVLGLGINVRSAPSVPEQRTTYTDAHSARPLFRAALAAELLNRFEPIYREGRSAGLDHLMADYLLPPDS